jgi:uncharacterized repeat protein (TIGR01451 family)
MWSFAGRALPAAAAVVVGAALIGGGLAVPAATSARAAATSARAVAVTADPPASTSTAVSLDIPAITAAGITGFSGPWAVTHTGATGGIDRAFLPSSPSSVSSFVSVATGVSTTTGTPPGLPPEWLAETSLTRVSGPSLTAKGFQLIREFPEVHNTAKCNPPHAPLAVSDITPKVETAFGNVLVPNGSAVTVTGVTGATLRLPLVSTADLTFRLTKTTETTGVTFAHADTVLTITGTLRNLSGKVIHTGLLATLTLGDVAADCTLPRADIHLVKSAFPRQYGAPGEVITYTYTVTNTGNLTLRDITVTDDKISAPITCLVTTLAPGDSTTCESAYITTAADVTAGHVTNTATVTGHPPIGSPVTDRDTDTVTARPIPGIELRKTAFPTQYAEPGEVITYSYVVTNTGNVTLHRITVNDDKLGPVTCPIDVLAPGEDLTCTATRTITTADVDAGSIRNTAIATGHPPTGPPVTDTDSDIVHAIHIPGIQVEKIATPATYAHAGQEIAFTYQVTNTGNVTLTRVTVTDSKIPGPIPCAATTLAPGQTTTCHATYTITQADVDAGHATNVATATGHPPTGPPVTDRGEETITSLPAAAIKLVKTSFPDEYGAPGEIITYTYTVTNTGNVTLHGITVTDDRVPPPITCQLTTLAPGQSTTCESVYTVTEADLDAGEITNTATATGFPPTGPSVSDTDMDTDHAIYRPGIQLGKNAFPTQYAVPGEVITYTYTVINTGNVTLTGVTVTDSRVGPVSCPLDVLGPGASMTCTGTHTITAADVAAGHVTDTATATGHPPVGPPVTGSDSKTIHAIQRPGIQIRKIASPATYSAAGQTIAFTYLVVNTGTNILTDITVTDSKISGLVRCMTIMLVPGASTTCHAAYTTTNADMEAGHATDVATATGHPPTGPPVTDRDEVVITEILPVVPVTG